MKAEPRCLASQLRAFIDALDRLEFDVDPLLAAVGIRRSELDDPDGTVPRAAVNGVVGRACEQRRYPNLGAHMAAATPIGAYPLLDYLVVTSDTVADALDQLVRYFHLANAPVRLAVVRQDGARLLVQGAANAFTAEYEVSMVVHHLVAETNHRLQPSYVSLAHEPENRVDLERLFGCPVRASSTWTGVEFSPDALRLPLRRRDTALRSILEGHAASVSSRGRDPADHSAVAGVSAVVASRLAHGVPTLGVVARQLAIAPRTLQRRLTLEGVSYNQVVDRVRRDAAERLLANASISIGEIGYLLGFSEPSAFHRAFRRWHGVTPQQYRRAAG